MLPIRYRVAIIARWSDWPQQFAYLLEFQFQRWHPFMLTLVWGDRVCFMTISIILRYRSIMAVNNTWVWSIFSAIGTAVGSRRGCYLVRTAVGSRRGCYLVRTAVRSRRRCYLVRTSFLTPYYFHQTHCNVQQQWFYIYNNIKLLNFCGVLGYDSNITHFIN